MVEITIASPLTETASQRQNLQALVGRFVQEPLFARALMEAAQDARSFDDFLFRAGYGDICDEVKGYLYDRTKDPDPVAAVRLHVTAAATGNPPVGLY